MAAVIDRLDIVAIGIIDKGRVIAGVVVGEQAGRAIIGCASSLGRLIKGLDP